MLFSRAVFCLFAATAAAARDIVITVGHNTTGNGSTVFQPQRVTAELGDTVIFNFTLGNHTATQSTFSSPCTPAHDTNITINGFDSSFRDAGNGTAITILTVPMLPQNVNQTMWFYDFNTCGQGGVGVINNNESSSETLAGFVLRLPFRNAIRLNGTSSSSSSSSSSAAGSGSNTASASQSAPSTSQSTSGTSSSPAADLARAMKLGVLVAVPLFLAGVLL
ncbi:fasciclin-like protein [Heterobasidion irregulare TC 32-1]|uniref:Fasciclin-like protein n=1 Tax=Heterobasidion irregulare (strain TC 32-1) TaxID=747525 RepID=W4JMU2_HETIT|nr:fasciclin-like protein [Heterobasidion irregulare TC 32-1]ETW74848.1 fasciclin-like protein [Heterobasidion irregulare TC 32-1]